MTPERPPINECIEHEVPYGVPGFNALRDARVLVCGLGNIGSYLVGLLGNLVGLIRIVDRGRVKAGNFANQAYSSAGSIGKFKVDVMADRLVAEYPGLVVERRAMDLQLLPMGDVDDVDICFGGLDSLLARQMLISDRAYPLGVPVIDGGVGAPCSALCGVTFLDRDASSVAGRRNTTAPLLWNANVLEGCPPPTFLRL